MPREITGDLVVRTQRFGIVVSRFNDFITSRLRDGAVDTLRRHGCPDEQMIEVWVPGSLEIALAASTLAESGKVDALICLGCVIRGQTPHFDYVAAETARGIAQLGTRTGIPAAFGLITANTLEQAIERAGTKAGNKGADAALTAIEMTNLLAKITGKD